MVNALILVIMTVNGPFVPDGFPKFYEDNAQCNRAMVEVIEVIEEELPEANYLIDCFEKQPKGEPV